MINNSNILTTGSASSNDNFLSFYSKLKNYTTIIEVRVAAPGRSREIICPDGCFAYELNFIADQTPGQNIPSQFILYVNGGRVDLQGVSDDVVCPVVQAFKKPGTPFVQVADTLQIQNDNFVGTFQFIFHRIMLKDS